MHFSSALEIHPVGRAWVGVVLATLLILNLWTFALPGLLCVYLVKMTE